jgi:hypothetical protein
MRTHAFILLAATTLGLGAAAVPAHAFDLTGHWVGKWSCKGFDGAKFSSRQFLKTSTMDITQIQGTFAIAIDAANDNFTYNGSAIPDTDKPEKGEVAFLGCHLGTTLAHDPLDGELVRAAVKTSTKVGDAKASFKGTSVFANDFPDVGTCKYSYKRLDTIDPGLSACP